ncbi:hypothetical protein MTR67_003562 [Solanum verrucosum]|nr:hypothetical protein MTR67_003562 [Solanum verrucosum]
MDSRSVL